MANPAAFSDQPVAKSRERQRTAQNVGLGLTALISALVLVGWLVPTLGSMWPDGWSQMKANTALAMMLSASALALVRFRRKGGYLLGGVSLAGAVVVLSGEAMLEHLTGRSFELGNLLALDKQITMPGRMSAQTAAFLLLLGLCCLVEFLVPRLSHLLDGVTGLLIFGVVILIAGYVFVAPHLIGQTPTTHTSPQTLVCMVLLTFVVTTIRTHKGYLSTLVGEGGGSKNLRTFLPFTVLATFALAAVGYYAMFWGWLPVSSAAALAASSIAFLLMIVGVAGARMINKAAALIAESESRFRSFAENSSDVFVIMALDGSIEYVNHGFETLTGYPAAELYANPNLLLELTIPADREMVARHMRFQGASSASLEFRHLRADGTTGWVNVRLNTITDEAGRPMKIVSLAHDITPRKRDQEERESLLLELQNSLGKVKLLSGLVPICAGCKMVRDDTGYWQQVESYVRDHSEAEFSHSMCPDCMVKYGWINNPTAYPKTNRDDTPHKPEQATEQSAGDVATPATVPLLGAAPQTSRTGKHLLLPSRHP